MSRRLSATSRLEDRGRSPAICRCDPAKVDIAVSCTPAPLRASVTLQPSPWPPFLLCPVVHDALDGISTSWLRTARNDGSPDQFSPSRRGGRSVWKSRPGTHRARPDESLVIPGDELPNLCCARRWRQCARSHLTSCAASRSDLTDDDRNRRSERADKACVAAPTVLCFPEQSARRTAVRTQHIDDRLPPSPQSTPNTGVEVLSWFTPDRRVGER